jgi:hypothetical protein
MRPTARHSPWLLGIAANSRKQPQTLGLARNEGVPGSSPGVGFAVWMGRSAPLGPPGRGVPAEE